MKQIQILLDNAACTVVDTVMTFLIRTRLPVYNHVEHLCTVVGKNRRMHNAFEGLSAYSALLDWVSIDLKSAASKPIGSQWSPENGSSGCSLGSPPY